MRRAPRHLYPCALLIRDARCCFSASMHFYGMLHLPPPTPLPPPVLLLSLAVSSVPDLTSVCDVQQVLITPPVGTVRGLLTEGKAATTPPPLSIHTQPRPHLSSFSPRPISEHLKDVRGLPKGAQATPPPSFVHNPFLLLQSPSPFVQST